MSVIILLIFVSLMVGLVFLGAFIWSVRAGQYEDTLTPAMRVLMDETTAHPNVHDPEPQKPDSSSGKAGSTLKPQPVPQHAQL